MNGERGVLVEDWYPPWSKQLALAHAGGTHQLFIVHGNVGDLCRTEKKEGASYSMLPEFLATLVFGSFDSVLYYDQVRGPRALANTQARLEKINHHIERYIGIVEQLRNTRESVKVFPILDRYLELALLRGGEKPSIAIILDYAHFMVPASAVSNTSRTLAPTLATLLNWAKSPYFKRAPFAFVLISERLSDLHESLVRSAHTARIEIPYPGLKERREFIDWTTGSRDWNQLCDVTQDQLAELTAGLSLVHLQGLMQRAIRAGKRISPGALKTYKKQMIEGECQSLVEFVEPGHGLELVVGHHQAKRHLKEDAELIREGHLKAVPMGYLLCGPVGTGKTFLAECYAGSVGIPCVKLLNFRSKYVGETEGNLEKILKVLKVMGPVAVIIDEADAALGDRDSGGDSGTSGRVFGQFAAQMGDTAYRGKIIWFLLTCRPDLLPIDIKRQGRCEVHIPLFYPEGADDWKDMFVVMGKKNHVQIAADEVPEPPEGQSLSGADIEGIVNRAQRLALIEKSKDVSGEHLQRVLADFVPAADSEEKQLQILAAMLETTDIRFLPQKERHRSLSPKGRRELLRRFTHLKATFSS